MSEVGVRLTGDNSEFKGMLTQSVAVSDNAFGQMASQVGKRFAGMETLSRTFAAAVGLNINSIVDNVARFGADMSKETEEIFKKLDDLRTRTANANIAAMKSRRTEEQNYSEDLKASIRLEKEISDLKGQQVDVTKLYNQLVAQGYPMEAANAEVQAAVVENQKRELAIEEKTGAQREVNDRLKAAGEKRTAEAWRDQIEDVKEFFKESDAGQKRDEDATKSRISAEEKLSKMMIDRLGIDDQIAVVQRQVAGSAHDLAMARAQGLPTVESETKLIERQNELATLIERKGKAVLEVDKERLKFIDEQNKSFETQLDKIRVMAGQGKGGFQANEQGGGQGMISVGELTNSRINAEGALEEAYRQINAPGGAQRLLNAQKLVRELKAGEDRAKMGILGSTIGGVSGSVSIASLGIDYSPDGSGGGRVEKLLRTGNGLLISEIQKISKSPLFNTDGLNGSPAPTLNAEGLG